MWVRARRSRSCRVAERGSREGGAARETTSKGSTSIGARFAEFRTAIGDAERAALLITAAGAIAGILMIVAELTTVTSVDVAHGSCEVINDADPALADRCALSGLERHGGALLLIGLLALLMAWGAGVGRSRPAGIALILAGGIVLAIGLLSDLPVVGDTGAIGRNFEGAKAEAGIALYLELIAGALAVLAGLTRVLRGPD
jgi:hypothetical protein